MKKLISIAFICILVLGGCSTTKEESTTENSRTIETINGSKTIEEVPQSVVSLDLGYTEILLSLGIEPVASVAPESISGEFPYYIQETLTDDSMEIIGEEGTFDIDKIKELKPDLIIGTSTNEGIYDDLNNIAPTLLWDDIDINSLGWPYFMSMLAPIFDKEEEATNIIEAYTGRVNELNNIIAVEYPDSKVMYVNIADGAFEYVYEGILYNGLDFIQPSELDKLNEQKEEFTADTLLEIDPDYLIVGTNTINDITNVLEEKPELEQLNVYGTGNYYEVDPVLWGYGFGPISTDLKLNQVEEFLK